MSASPVPALAPPEVELRILPVLGVESLPYGLSIMRQWLGHDALPQIVYAGEGPDPRAGKLVAPGQPPPTLPKFILVATREKPPASSIAAPTLEH